MQAHRGVESLSLRSLASLLRAYVNICDLDNAECEGRCQSGRLGPPAKRLTVLKPFKGSNPFLPAYDLADSETCRIIVVKLWLKGHQKEYALSSVD